MRYELASTQHHFSMEGRDLVRVGTLSRFSQDPTFAESSRRAPAPGETCIRGSYPNRRVGHGIDLNTCIGCGACVIACQAENNIPIVGKEEVGRGREMHWLRIDRYYRGRPTANPSVLLPARPVHALRERPLRAGLPGRGDGPQRRRAQRDDLQPLRRHAVLLEQLPVQGPAVQFPPLRRTGTTPSLKALRNPDVTVRSRGVMEKCTYCVQRINDARDRRRRRRPAASRDGEVVTACQAACPTRAIVFGNLNDPQSAVAQPQGDRRAITRLLAELNTRPRTTYLARLRNPNPRDSRHDSADGTAELAAPASRREPDERPRPDGADPAWPHVRLGDRQDQRDRPRRARTTRAWISGFAIAFAADAAVHVRHHLPARRTASASGASTIPVAWGFAIVNFVWWIGIGHAGTLISAILLLLQQDWRTSINRFAEAMTLFAVACAGAVPAAAPGAALVLLLAVALSEHDGTLAAVPQSAGLGRVRGLDLRHRLALVLVHRPDPRPGHAARPRTQPARRRSSTASWRWAGAARPSTGIATRRPTCCWPGWRRRWSSRSTASSASTSPSPSCPAGTPRSSRRTSSPARSSRASRWS